MDAEFQQDAAIIFDEVEIEFYGFIRNHVVIFIKFCTFFFKNYFCFRFFFKLCYFYMLLAII